MAAIDGASVQYAALHHSALILFCGAFALEAIARALFQNASHETFSQRLLFWGSSMPTIDSIAQFATAPGQATGPDSITTADGFVWVAYTNGADSTGGSGDSTIVQYDLQGHIVHTYTLPGYVDGLKFNPQ